MPSSLLTVPIPGISSYQVFFIQPAILMADIYLILFTVGRGKAITLIICVYVEFNKMGYSTVP